MGEEEEEAEDKADAEDKGPIDIPPPLPPLMMGDRLNSPCMARRRCRLFADVGPGRAGLSGYHSRGLRGEESTEETEAAEGWQATAPAWGSLRLPSPCDHWWPLRVRLPGGGARAAAFDGGPAAMGTRKERRWRSRRGHSVREVRGRVSEGDSGLRLGSLGPAPSACWASGAASAWLRRAWASPPWRRSSGRSTSPRGSCDTGGRRSPSASPSTPPPPPSAARPSPCPGSHPADTPRTSSALPVPDTETRWPYGTAAAPRTARAACDRGSLRTRRNSATRLDRTGTA